MSCSRSFTSRSLCPSAAARKRPMPTPQTSHHSSGSSTERRRSSPFSRRSSSRTASTRASASSTRSSRSARCTSRDSSRSRSAARSPCSSRRGSRRPSGCRASRTPPTRRSSIPCRRNAAIRSARSWKACPVRPGSPWPVSCCSRATPSTRARSGSSASSLRSRRSGCCGGRGRPMVARSPTRFAPEGRSPSFRKTIPSAPFARTPRPLRSRSPACAQPMHQYVGSPRRSSAIWRSRPPRRRSSPRSTIPTPRCAHRPSRRLARLAPASLSRALRTTRMR